MIELSSASSTVTALSFTVALLKLLTVYGFKDWYCKAKFHAIALFKTRFAFVYIAISLTAWLRYASVSLLPAHLPPR